jgi:uncharacterized protein (UPF0332 family)
VLLLDKINAYFERSKEFIEIAEDNLNIGHYETAINRSYYSVYYAVIALLLKEGKSPKTHHGTRKLFSQVFVKDKNFNKELFDFYSELLNNRETADYDMFSDFTKNETKEIINRTTLFIQECEKFLCLKNDIY